jgi:hypothetical protein
MDVNNHGVTKDTVHEDILGDNDPRNEQVIYRGMISVIIKKNNETTPKWPNNWLKKTSAELAPVLLK